MTFYDAEPETREQRIGKDIYYEALFDRRGFRDDQLGIEDPEIWLEIFQEIGEQALLAVKAEEATND